MEANSEDQGVQNLAEVQRGAVAKVLESFGLTPPLTAAEQQHWQLVGGDLRGMEISGEASDSWRDIISRAEIRQKAEADIVAAQEKLAQAQAEAEARAAELLVQIEEQKLRVTVVEGEVASTEAVLADTRRRVVEMSPLAEEAQAARDAEEAKAEAVTTAKTEMDQALAQRALFSGDSAHQVQVATLDKSVLAAAEKWVRSGPEKRPRSLA